MNEKELLLSKVNAILERYQDGMITDRESMNEITLIVLKYCTNQPDWSK